MTYTEYVENCKKIQKNLNYDNKEINDLIVNNYFEDILLIDIRRMFNKRFKSKTHFSKNFWIERGWSEDIAKEKVSETQRRNSPRCKEYWIKKGFSIDEAKEKVSEIQKCNSSNSKEYWIKKGFSIDEAKEKVSEWAKKGSVRCKEYWIKKGFSIDEAKEKVSEIQSRGKEYWIKKYGEVDGIKKYDSFCAKCGYVNTKEYIVDKYGIEFYNNVKDERTGRYNIDWFKNKYGAEVGLLKYHQRYANIHVGKNKTDYLKRIEKKYSKLEKIKIESFSFEYWISKYINKHALFLWFDNDITKFYNFIPDYIKKSFKNNLSIGQRNSKKFRNYFMYTDSNEYLSSAGEINFYFLLKYHKIEYKFGILYPSSNMRTDFYLPEYDIWVEIAGMMSDEKYKKKMKYKSDNFGAVILQSIPQQEKFIKELKSLKKKYVNVDINALF